jgi:hypothetical protein
MRLPLHLHLSLPLLIASVASQHQSQDLPFLAASSAPKARIEDPSLSTCTAAQVFSANERQLGVILEDLVETDFFRYFRVDLGKECVFWRKDGQVKNPGQLSRCFSPTHTLLPGVVWVVSGVA